MSRTARNRLRNWLDREARYIPRTREFVEELGTKLVEAGVPLRRLMVSVGVIHPQIRARSYTWQQGQSAVVMNRGYDIFRHPEYINSPMHRLHEGARQVRRRIGRYRRTPRTQLVRDLQLMGMTDYIALPLPFSDGTINGITLATDRKDGFSDAHLGLIREVLPTITMILEIQVGRRVAATLLNTYVGQQAGERILRGEIRRGMGQQIRAVIWYGDLRGFTSLSDVLPTDKVIDLLNGYFERMTEAIHGHGGQVLKLIGDGILGIVPLGDAAFHHYSCRQALLAAIEAEEAMETWNTEREAAGEPRVRMGQALHVGEIVFGNIGAPDRLDFTAIGPAVNLTARLEHLSAALEVPILMSKAFADAAGESRPLVSLGRYELRGVRDEQEVFTLPGLEPHRHKAGVEPLIADAGMELAK